MKKWYLIGEPLFHPSLTDEHLAPMGQVGLFQRVLSAPATEGLIVERWAVEYVSIIDALIAMKVPFRVHATHEHEIDSNMVAELNRRNCQIAKIGDSVARQVSFYIRDLCVSLSKAVLINDRVCEETDWIQNGLPHWTSPLGMGGRILNSGDVVLASRFFYHQDQVFEHLAVPRAEFDRLRKLGLRVASFPAVAAQWFKKNRPISGASFGLEDRIDRVGCLLKGADGKEYLLLQDRTFGLDVSKNYIYLPDNFRDVIRSECELIGVEVITVDEMSVPYSLNLIQFDDGRVLMTSGDQAAYEAVCKIVGAKRVFTTSVPIEYLPVWAEAGIRRLVNDVGWLYTESMKQFQ